MNGISALRKGTPGSWLPSKSAGCRLEEALTRTYDVGLPASRTVRSQPLLTSRPVYGVWLKEPGQMEPTNAHEP